MTTTDLKQLLDSFFETRKKIHDYFGYSEDWRTIPLMDSTSYYWNLREKENGSGDIRYHEERLTKEFIEGGGHYSAVIYTQSFLPKFVYRADDYTLVSVDTQTDGNKYLMVFDNKKECPDVSEYSYGIFGL